MPERVCVLVCRHYAAEAAAACLRSELPGIRVEAYPARCGRPCMAFEELESFRTRPGEALVVFGGACLGKLDPAQAKARGMAVQRFDLCQSMLVNAEILESRLTQGAYLVTGGWLQDWPARLEEQGEDAAAIRELWRETVRFLLLLDSGVGGLREPFSALCAHLGLPGETLSVGLDHFRLVIERGVLGVRMRLQAARSEGSLSRAQREAADRATAIEFLAALSRSLQFEEVLQGIHELFQMLFQAREVSVLTGQALEGPQRELGDRPYLTHPGGFLVPLATSSGLAGVLKVQGLAHPRFKEHYLNLAISMAGVCALAIQNSRVHRLAEASQRYQRLLLDVLDVYHQPEAAEQDSRRVLEHLKAYSGADGAALRLREGPRLACVGELGYPEGFFQEDCQHCMNGLLGEGGADLPEAIRGARGSYRINDLAQGGGHRVCAGAGFRSVAVVPVDLGKGGTGVIQLHSRRPEAFGESLMEQLEGVARSIGIGLHRRWAEAELRAANRDLETRVAQRTLELGTLNQELHSEVLERRRAESRLEAQSALLQVRLKQLHCLYELSSLFEIPPESVEEVCREAIRRMPSGWTHPERTQVRLRLDDRCLSSEGFRETASCLSEPVLVRGRLRGWLEIFLDPEAGPSAFVREEQELIRTMRDLVQGLVDHVEVSLEKEKVKQQMVQSQKLEALGTLAGGIAHDFNNALTPILALADLCLMTLPGSSPQRHHIGIIKQSADRAKALVDQILLFSRKKEMTRQPVALTPVLMDILKLIRATLPSTIEIREAYSLAGDTVLGDPTQIHQIIMNLCTNAFHAMEGQGGTLSLELRPVSVDEGDALHRLGLAPGPYAQILVSDTGKGMGPELRSRIFEPFFTTKAAGKGTGMGLAVVHGIVRSYRGHIAVYSEPGKGTTFRVYLPLAGTGEGASPAGTSAAAVPRGRERILVVDDEEAIRWSLGVMLQDLGYLTDTAEDALEALDKLGAEPEGFDLVLADTTMPRMTGLELVQRIRESGWKVRVILCSGFSDQLSPERLRAEGIQEFLQKPFTLVEIAQAIRRVLDAGPPDPGPPEAGLNGGRAGSP